MLCGIDLDVPLGQTLVVLGRSGGGKSVLLKHIIGLMKPDRGEVIVEGQDVVNLSERDLGAVRKKIAILFQSAALFDSMSVEENVAFPLHEAGIKDRKAIDGQGEQVLSQLDQSFPQPLRLRGHKERSLRPFLEHHLDDAEEEILLATGKMIVQSCRGDLHLLGDLFHGNALVSPGEEELLGRFENLLPGFAVSGR